LYAVADERRDDYGYREYVQMACEMKERWVAGVGKRGMQVMAEEKRKKGFVVFVFFGAVWRFEPTHLPGVKPRPGGSSCRSECD